MSDLSEKIRIRELIVLVLLVIAGLIFRVDFLYHSDFRIDSDEAIVGLMAKHLLEGKALPTFYYGQHYMGSLEAWLAAQIFKLTGPTSLSLKIVPLSFSLMLIPLFYLIAREIGGKRAAFISGVLTVLPPAGLMVWGLKARGGFVELVFIGGLALLFTIRFLKSDNPKLRELFVIALLLGFGWWVNFQIIYFIPPILSFCLIKIIRGRSLSCQFYGLLIIVAGVLLGSLPFWIHNLQTDFASLDLFGRPRVTGRKDNLAGFFSSALPMILGARRFWTEKDVFIGSMAVFYIAYAILLLIIISVRFREWLKFFVFRLPDRSGIELLLGFMACTAVVFVASSFGHLVLAPRYLLPFYAGLIPLTGVVIGLYLKPRLALAMALLLLTGNSLSCYLGRRAIEGEPYVYQQERVSKDHTELIRWLKKKSFAWVRTNYWIGYRLAFETQEQVRFVVFADPHEARIPEYEKAGRQLGLQKLPIIVTPGQAMLLRRAYQASGYSFREKEISGYFVFFNILPPDYADKLSPVKGLRAYANYSSAGADSAVDGDQSTRWGTGSPQSQGMEFKVILPQAVAVYGIKYSLGKWAADYPRSLSIEFVGADGKKTTVLNDDQFYSLKYLWDGEGEQLFYYPGMKAKEIVFKQSGAHPVFDWSIAEIEVYTVKDAKNK